MDPPQPRVTSIIVTYQSRGTVAQALDALLPLHTAGFLKAIVVDNNSTDGTPAFISASYPWVRLSQNTSNLGFGTACNQALQAVTTPYILLLNPDAVLDAHALHLLVNFMEEHHRAGICAPAVQYGSGVFQHVGARTTPWKVLLAPLCSNWACRGRRYVLPGDRPFLTDWICGCTMLIRKRVIDEIGMFDQRFFLYFEETDLCFRAQQSGWEIWAVGESVGTHIGAASAKAGTEDCVDQSILKHYFESRFYYMTKHYGWFLAAVAEIGERLCLCVRAALNPLRRRPSVTLRQRLRAPFLRLPAHVDEARNDD